MTDPRLQQIADQCRVVAHLAGVLAGVHEDYAKMFANPESAASIAGIADMVGNRTAQLMEELGDVLNGMDAVDEGDEWTEPVFDKAHEMFPQ